MSRNRVVFCDFDGTITREETFVAMLKEFAPELSAKLIPEMYALRLTLREGVREILESIPSNKYQDIINFSRTKAIRPGLSTLLDFLHTEGVPFVVVSGGLKGMVENVLGDLVKKVEKIYAVDLDLSGIYCQVKSPMESETELVDKVKIMSLYPTDQSIAIGDSVTDLNMGMKADLVFARDRLANYLDERQKPYIFWDDFDQIRDHLQKLWQI